MPEIGEPDIAGLKYGWKNQPIDFFDKVNPTQNQWYTAFEKTGGVKLYYFMIGQKNDGATNKHIAARVTMDGDVLIPYDTDFLFASNAFGCIMENVSQIMFVESNNAARLDDGFPYDLFMHFGTYGYSIFEECHSLKIEIEITDAPGTNQHLYCKTRYNTLEAIT